MHHFALSHPWFYSLAQSIFLQLFPLAHGGISPGSQRRISAVAAYRKIGNAYKRNIFINFSFPLLGILYSIKRYIVIKGIDGSSFRLELSSSSIANCVPPTVRSLFTISEGSNLRQCLVIACMYPSFLSWQANNFSGP